MTPCKLLFLSLLGLFVGQYTTAAAADDLAGWEEHIFKGQTLYSMDGSSTSDAIKASCIDTASALYQEKEVDLLKTPVLRWSWKIGGVQGQLREREKSGDDYPARIYAVYTPNRLTPWRTLAIDYVWSNNQKIGSVWPNAFTKNAIMVALQSGAPISGQDWKQEARNIRDDFKAFFNIDVASIDGIAIMTDCDNAHLSMTGFYKNIHFSSE